MNTYAKLINGQLHYATNFEKIEDNWVSNPTEEQLKMVGYKELIDELSDVTDISYEEREDCIVRLLPFPEDLGQDIIEILQSTELPENVNQVDTEEEYDAASVETKKNLFTWISNWFKR